MIGDAMRVAARGHENQTDLQGRPYLLHVLRVAAGVARRGGSDKAVVVALLHDLREDAELLPDDRQLADAFGEDVLEALRAVTRKKGEEYGAYIERVRKNELATEVKLADLRDNMDPLRMHQLRRSDPEKAKRLGARYAAARRLLEEG